MGHIRTEFSFCWLKLRQAEILSKLRYIGSFKSQSQPWLFEIVDNSIELYADRVRGLPVVDPEDRALTISCGVALYHLILAIRHFGFEHRLEILPTALLTNHDKHDSIDDDLLARVILEDMDKKRQIHSEEDKMFQAITKRRTNRSVFQDRGIPELLLSKLEDAIHELQTRILER